MMVDGRYPLLGSDRPKALAALRGRHERARRSSLDLALAGDGDRKSLTVRVAARSAEAGRDLLVGVAVTEDPVTTKVPSGENAGRTLVEHHVVRRFDHKFIRVKRTGSQSLAFPVELPPVVTPRDSASRSSSRIAATAGSTRPTPSPGPQRRPPARAPRGPADLERTIAHRKRTAPIGLVGRPRRLRLQAVSVFLESSDDRLPRISPKTAPPAARPSPQTTRRSSPRAPPRHADHRPDLRHLLKRSDRGPACPGPRSAATPRSRPPSARPPSARTY